MNLNKNKPNPRATGPAKTAPRTAPDEVSAALLGEIARCMDRAAEQAEALESIGAQSFSIACGTFASASAKELRQHSHGIRGLVVHALAILVELQFIAGRLEALSALREANDAQLR